MNVDFAFLAEAAETINGKLYLIGGAIDTIWTETLPIVYPRLSFVMRLLFSLTEIGRAHHIELNLMNEDGKVLARVSGDIHVSRNPQVPGDWEQGFLAVLNFAGLTFERFGEYRFELVADHVNLHSSRLHIAQQVQPRSN